MQALQDLEVKKALLQAEVQSAKATQAELEDKVAGLRLPQEAVYDLYTTPPGLPDPMPAGKGQA
eukprot:6635245-Pyramimonas_sp.AAC.1